MPYKMRRLSSGKVRVTSPHRTLSKGTTMKKAKAQVRLVNAVKHGWHPTRRKR